MYVRLAFAVAAHLEPDILIVDEVLAVGDTEFQKKCLGKMEEVSKSQGRTVLFVSHNVIAINQLCNQCFLLDKGEVIDSGTTQFVTEKYSAQNLKHAMNTEKSKKSFENIYLHNIELQNTNDPWKVSYGQNLKLKFVLETKIDIPDFRFGIGFNKINGFSNNERISTVHSEEYILKKGVHTIVADVENILVPGVYEINAGVLNRFFGQHLAILQVLNTTRGAKKRHEDINFGLVDLKSNIKIERL
jgi:lipopolysaccharide transport system ATP-binding protein